MSTQFFLEETDIDTLLNLLLRSQQSRTREALCFSIGIDPKRLSFIRDSSESDFFLLLIRHLNEIGEKEALCKLCCKELLPIFNHGKYASILSDIAAKLDCDQEFIHNSNNNTEKKTTQIEKIVKFKSKLHIGQASFLLISALSLSLSAIYTYLWFPDIWSSARTPVGVKATSDPWLAGMPDKSRASVCKEQFFGKIFGSVAPQNSPTEVQQIPLISGNYLLFKVDGTTRHNAQVNFVGPNGDMNERLFHERGAENGISNIYAPVSSLVGVFLGAEQPNPNKDSPPRERTFNSPNRLNYFTISPQLNQVFFIGDGRTIMGIKKRVIVPPEAKRFYLGTFDGCGWEDNQGLLNVEVTVMSNNKLDDLVNKIFAY